jgi:hypothetical protein
MMGVIGYLNPVLLLVLPAQVILIVYWLLRSQRVEPSAAAFPVADAPRPWAKLFCWLGGCGLAGLLLWPYLGYLQELRHFAHEHRQFLWQVDTFSRLPWLALLLHNSALIVAITVLMFLRRLEQRRPATTPQESLQTDNRTLTRSRLNLPFLALVWLLVPALLASLLAYALRQPIVLSRYLSYTTLGGLLFLAWMTGQSFSAGRRLRAGLTMGLALLVWGLLDMSRGVGLFTDMGYSSRAMVAELDALHDSGRWRDGDVVLLRPVVLEADLYPVHIPADTRQAVGEVLVAPLTLLYPRQERNVIPLSLSPPSTAGDAGRLPVTGAANEVYGEQLANRLRSYRRFWLVTQPFDRAVYVASLLAWMSRVLGQDLELSLMDGTAHRIARDADPATLTKQLQVALESKTARLVLITPVAAEGAIVTRHD